MSSFPISGYVLAGGRSSRMGRDKALQQLGGKPLIAHAVAKLRQVCADVSILSATPELGAYGPLVPDLHPDCGPVGGIEAALGHSSREWSLILPVDVPFLPVRMLESLAGGAVAEGGAARVAMFGVGGRLQPAVCLLHRDIAPSIAAAVALEEFQLRAVLEAAASVFALQNNHGLDEVLVVHPVAEKEAVVWFANLNTPEDFAAAEANVALLDI